ncbi:Cell division protein FtsH, partial [hydrothermal vent metagenome]
MRFVITNGTDPVGTADPTLLRALKLPDGGVIRVGNTHCKVVPGDVSGSSLALGPLVRRNAGLELGASVDVDRVAVSAAQRVGVTGGEPLDTRQLARSLQGRVVSNGDAIEASAAYGDTPPDDARTIVVESVTPNGVGLITSASLVHQVGAETEQLTAHPTGGVQGESITTAQALLTGLDMEREALTGWLSLLTSPDRLPDTWGLPAAAGVILEGPTGCGKSELVADAAQATGAFVHEVPVDLVFKADKLLTLLETAVTTVQGPAVIFIDRLDSISGDSGLFRDQVGAILRWFLDKVTAKPGVACVLGVSQASALGQVVDSPLLPRTLTVPPPNTERRTLLFRAALAQVPTGDIEYEHFGGRTAGFSAADIVAAVQHASALATAGDGVVTQELLTRAVEETTPSLTTASLGEIPSYGFERVANLVEVKQRLTETVIWQLEDPERFERLGIEAPKGLLLYGPPGTGKTFVIRALANESGAAFFPVKGAELLDKFVGESERGVREIFARARAVAPSIIFFDEIDALVPVRGNSNNSVTDSVVAALLTELDGVVDRGDVFVIGATNRRDLVDPALLRPGRLEVHLELGLPAPESRRAYLRISDVPLEDGISEDWLVEATDGLSFAELSGLFREAALQALRRDTSTATVTKPDLDKALETYTA